MAEERVEHLREELKEMKQKRDDSFLKPPPPPYVSPSIKNSTISRSSSRGTEEVKHFNNKNIFYIN
jgi:hypothetical protein